MRINLTCCLFKVTLWNYLVIGLRTKLFIWPPIIARATIHQNRCCLASPPIPRPKPQLPYEEGREITKRKHFCMSPEHPAPTRHSEAKSCFLSNPVCYGFSRTTGTPLVPISCKPNESLGSNSRRSLGSWLSCCRPMKKQTGPRWALLIFRRTRWERRRSRTATNTNRTHQSLSLEEMTNQNASYMQRNNNNNKPYLSRVNA